MVTSFHRGGETMKWRRMLMLGAALGTMALGQPESALARDCEDICADLAVKT